MNALRILLVEDDTMLRESVVPDMLRHLLSGCRLELDLAEGVERAWDYIQVAGYDLFLIDRNLHPGSGLELIAEIRACGYTGKVVLMSGSEQGVSRPRDRQEDAFLPKPYTMEDLRGLLRELGFLS